ncbi:hypothetical protein [Aneurinibacillus tyrosinisolvens]|uniref:hypothetical protein n=1 Tax=Aneurinibacillus tyrosinisolvens TaxID=1443435 RepID=UPI00063EF5B4|nr:hypothetical protein [Aneurinibacillus tyrosinisolvens]
MGNNENRVQWKVLHNPLGLEGKETKPVAVNYRFVNEVFNIERHYSKKESFGFTPEGEAIHELHHLTKADLAIMVILQKICDVRGKIADVTLADIVRAVHMYYEGKYSETQLYVSLKKFILHNLILCESDEETGRNTIWLNHYIDPDTDKPGKLVITHNIIFTKEFTELPVAVQKLYFSCIFRQFKEMQSFDLYNNQKPDVQWNNLLTFLHLSDTSQLRRILHTTLHGKRLFYMTTSNGDFIKVAGRYRMAEFKVNPDWTEQERKIGEGNYYHESIQPRSKYERSRKYLIQRAHEKGIGELEHHSHFFTVVRLLRKVSRKVKEVILNKIKDEYVQTKKLPFNLSQFVKNVLAEKRDTYTLVAAKQKKLQHFVRPAHLDSDVQAHTEKRFLELMRHYPLSDISKIFAAAQEAIAPVISSELASISLKDYRYATTFGKAHDALLRAHACRKHKSSPAYQRLILDFNSLVADRTQELFHMSQRERTEWLFNEIDKLPSIKEAPSIIRTFDLSEFILKTFSPEHATIQLSHTALA